MTDELTLKILREIAEHGSGHLFSRREAARSAISIIEAASARIAELEASLRASRRAALEEAARIWDNDGMVPNLAGQSIARAIRALSGPTEDVK